MPKKSQRADVNNFIAGLITEASPLNFPANASADEINFELNRDGSRQRRLGMDFEPSREFTYIAATPDALTGTAINSFTWNSVNGDPSVSLLVVQSGLTILFYNLNQDTVSAGGALASFTLPFTPGQLFSFAAVEGYLIVVGGGETFSLVSCNTSAVPMTFAIEQQRLQTRDVWGVQETGTPTCETDPTFRPLNLDDFHNYNLRNQSWGIPRKDKNGTERDPLTLFKTDLSTFPNSVEQVWVGVQQQPVSAGQDPFERIFTNLYNDALGASTKPAKGYFIIDLLRRGTSRVDAFNSNSAKYPVIAGSVNVPQDYTAGGPSCVADFAGRIFYSGFQGKVTGGDIRSPNLDNFVMFSQLIKSRKEFQKCYQDGDPTSRDTNDIVDTDGGFVRVSGARNIIALVNIQTHLAVIAENGVWAITGGTTDSGFTATNYKTSKISTFGGIGPASVVVAGEVAYYWSADGIYVISKNQFGDIVVDSLTLSTIQTLYQDIPPDSQAAAVGQYDPFSKKVRWIYKLGTRFTSTSLTYELIFDLATKAFTRNQIFNTAAIDCEVVGLFKTNAFRPSAFNEDVFAGVDNVLANTDQVIMASSSSSSDIVSIKYLVYNVQTGQVFLSFGLYRESTFTDWFSVDGVGTDAKAHCLTGTVTAGDSGVDKQIPYLIMHFERTEDGVDTNFQPIHQSSCLFRAQWEFANSVVSNRWTPLRQAYRYVKPRFVTSLTDDYNTGFELITTKNKLRGKGKAFALYFETEPGKDCKIIGWNVTLNANTIT